MTNQTINLNFNDYLKLNNAREGEEITHTKIGDKKNKLWGGSYNIQNWQNFMTRYYKSVFENGEKNYLTEKQLPCGAICVDFDFRYEEGVPRKHTEDHIIDMIIIYIDEIKNLMEIPDDETFEVFILEKPNVNKCEDKVKDGIHMIIALQMERKYQIELRNRVIPRLKSMWDDLPITNIWTDVVDEAVVKAQANWQMIGSCKPDNQTYALTYHYEIKDSEVEPLDISKFDFETFLRMSAQYPNHKTFPYKSNCIFEPITPPDSGYTTPTQSITDSKLEDNELKRFLDHVNNIKHTYAEKYVDWFKIGNAIKGTFSEDNWFNIFKEWSLRSTRTDSDHKNPDYDVWEVYFKKDSKCGIPTLLEYSKKSGLKNYNKIEKEFLMPKEIREQGLKLLLEEANKISKKEQKQLDKQQKEREKVDKREELLNDENNLIAQNDKEASEIIYKKIKDSIKFSKKILYYKNNYRWIDDEKVIESLLRNYVMNSGIKKLDNDNKICDYVENRRCATDITKTVIDKAITNGDDDWTNKMFSSSLGKILFSNGYYDFKKSKFYYHDDEEFDNSIIFIEHIPYPYLPFKETYRNISDVNDINYKYRHYDLSVRDKIFEDPFGRSVSNYYILQLARGLAGDAMKRILFGIGDGNTGKSGITVAIKSVCGGYFGSFNGNNITVKKYANPDDAQALRWLMLLAHKRLIISNEIGQDPVNGEILKKMASGGKDDIVARGHQKNETEYKISFLPIIFANDINKIAPMDDAVVQRVRAIPYTKKYVENVTDKDNELQIDPDYDDMVSTPHFRSAFMYLLTEAYKAEMEEKAKCITEKKPYTEYEPDEIKHAIKSTFGEIVDCVEQFKEEFEITNDPEDYLPNELIQEWLLKKKIGISLTKLTRDLNKYTKKKGLTIVENKPKYEEGKTIRGWFGIKN